MSTSHHDVRHSATLLGCAAVALAIAAAILALVLRTTLAERKGWEFLLVGGFSLVGILLGIMAIEDWPRDRRRRLR